MNHGLPWGIVAYHFGLLHFPGRIPEKVILHMQAFLAGVAHSRVHFGGLPNSLSKQPSYMHASGAPALQSNVIVSEHFRAPAEGGREDPMLSVRRALDTIGASGAPKRESLRRWYSHARMRCLGPAPNSSTLVYRVY